MDKKVSSATPAAPGRRPLRVMFLTTNMFVGGAETLLMNLVRRLDRERFSPEITCLKEKGPLGELLSAELPVASDLICHRFDLCVLPRLWRLMRSREIDVVVTVGAGDKMFWGRLAGRCAGVPVVVSALHSTGWPDSVGRLNRILTPWTDGFIGVANAHAQHLVEHEGFPAERVHTIYNGVDTALFTPSEDSTVRHELGIPSEAPVIGILAALRPEKNHKFFLNGAARILTLLPEARFLIIGDGSQRSSLESLVEELNITRAVHFLGSRDDIPELMSATDLLALTSHNEASPVSILEALSCQVPVVAARVGSVPESVVPGETGMLFEPGDLEGFVTTSLELLRNRQLLLQLGRQGRCFVESRWSLEAMVAGYESLLEKLYTEKTSDKVASLSGVSQRRQTSSAASI